MLQKTVALYKEVLNEQGLFTGQPGIVEET